MGKSFKIRLKDIERGSRLKLIENGGISKLYQKVLTDKYVEEKSIYEIADELGYTKESTYNLINRAKKDLETKLYTQYDLYSTEIQNIIDVIS